MSIVTSADRVQPFQEVNLIVVDFVSNLPLSARLRPVHSTILNRAPVRSEYVCTYLPT